MHDHAEREREREREKRNSCVVITGEVGDASDHFVLVQSVDSYARWRWWWRRFEDAHAERTALDVLVTVHYRYLPLA